MKYLLNDPREAYFYILRDASSTARALVGRLLAKIKTDLDKALLQDKKEFLQAIGEVTDEYYRVDILAKEEDIEGIEREARKMLSHIIDTDCLEFNYVNGKKLEMIYNNNKALQLYIILKFHY